MQEEAKVGVETENDAPDTQPLKEGTEKYVQTLMKAMEVIELQKGTLELLVKANHSLRKAQFIWKSIALFCLGFLGATIATQAINCYKVRCGNAEPPPQTAASESR